MRSPTSDAAKRPVNYEAPVLTVLGTVQALTEGPFLGPTTDATGFHHTSVSP